MQYVRWDGALELGIPEIDAQHKKLVDLINELYTAVQEKHTTEALQRILRGLSDYAKVHFATEERYFREFGYPEAKIHEQQHQDFVSKVADFQEKFEKGETRLPMEMMAFLRQWLVKHIQRSDSRYVPLFEENGLASAKKAEASVF